MSVKEEMPGFILIDFLLDFPVNVTHPFFNFFPGLSGPFFYFFSGLSGASFNLFTGFACALFNFFTQFFRTRFYILSDGLYGIPGFILGGFPATVEAQNKEGR